MTGQIRVPFSGERSGRHELSWGQRDSWRTMDRTGVSMCVGGVVELPPDTTVDSLVARMRFVLGRHEALRSRLRFEPDGRPYLELFDAGEFVIELVDVGDDDPGPTVAAIHKRFNVEVFDYLDEWPVRMAIVASNGTPTHSITAYNHLASDGPGLWALIRDMRTNLPAGPDGPAPPPVTATQPMDQAARQRLPAAQRQTARALRFWERELRRIPARRLLGSTDPRTPRFWELGFTSRALYLATPAVAARLGTGTSPVLLAAMAVAFGRYTGDHPFGVQVMVNNRFRPGYAESVSPLTQSVLCAIDTADTTFDEVVRHADLVTKQAYLNGYYDPDQLDDVVTAVGRERGEDIDVSCFFNDRRFVTPRQPTRPTPLTEADLRASTADSFVSERYKMDCVEGKHFDRFFLHVDDVPDVIRLFVLIDTWHIAPGDAETCLRSMEEVVVDAAFDAALPTGVRADHPDPRVAAPVAAPG
jgi:hypothetical protein